MKNKNGFKVTLTKELAEEMFHSALCNGLGFFESHGMELQYSDADYQSAKRKLKDPCFEDVLMQILKGGGVLRFEDIEGEGDQTKHITIKEVHERVVLTPLHHLNDMLEGNDDAITADIIIQSVCFEGEIIFG